LGVDLRLRHTPELHFVLDQSIAEGDRILRLMREVEREQRQP
jgi:ribosome-binding factor A